MTATGAAMAEKVCDRLCLDSAATDGLASEVSAPVAMRGLNAVQAQVVLFALTATSLQVQVQVSNDGVNWSNQGSAQALTGIGRKVLTAAGAIGMAYARLLFTLDGNGKAIVTAYVARSRQ